MVLIHDIVLNFVSLTQDTISSPHDQGHAVVYPNKFGLSGTFSVDALFSRDPIGQTFPSLTVVLVWLCISRCMVNDASTHHLIIMFSPALRVRARSFDSHRKLAHHPSFFQSSTSGFITQVHRNAMVGWISAQTLLLRYNSLAVRWWNSSACSSSIFCVFIYIE